MKNGSWTEEKLTGLVSGQVQESLSLDYKRAQSLGPTEGRRKEITKDVSAMANSAGGVIIYGIAEFESGDRKHYPERIDPVSLRDTSREWLEQVINTIQPRIVGIEITAVPVAGAPDSVVFVVDIPRSSTAHQATDHRYYKRFNFLSLPMEDYEVRDVMNRLTVPVIELDFKIEKSMQPTQQPIHDKVQKYHDAFALKTIARNVGTVYAMYVNAFISIPASALPDYPPHDIEVIDGQEYVSLYHENTSRDVVDFTGGPYSRPKYGPSRYDPILPGLSQSWSEWLDEAFLNDIANSILFWSVYADNSPMRKGEVVLGQIPIIDNT